MLPRGMVVSALILACCHSLTAYAGFITINEFDSGEVLYNRLSPSCSGSDSASHNATGLNGVGVDLIPGCFLGGALIQNTSGYLIFDLTSIALPVTSASVLLDIDGITGADGALQLYDYTLTSAADLAALPGGPLSIGLAADLQDDLSSGNLLGSQSITGASITGVYDLSLSGYALNQINSTNSLLAIGVTYEPSGAGDLFSEQIGIAGPTRLRLEFAGVPSPATISLLVLGFAVMGLFRQRNF